MDFNEYWKNGCFGEYHDIYAKNLADQFYNAGQQSKQAEIDELSRKLRMYEKHVNAIKHIHKTQFDYESDTSWVLGNLDGFFEYLEADLRGEKYDH